MSIEKKILVWIASGETGVSSKAMAFAAVGIENKGSFGNHAPSDPADFNRCLKLVKEIPEIENHFDTIADLSDDWELLIDRWEEVEKCFLDEVGFDWCNARKAPKTYALMKEVMK
tara:strand:+ start:130 stop:474 length:345 start_codon:yes stop_codon:yes gene_type:complete